MDDDNNATTIEVTTTRGRNFTGTVGLVSGYFDKEETAAAPTFERVALLDAWESWARERHREGGAICLGAKFSSVQILTYAFVEEKEGGDQEEGRLKIYREPVVTVSGEIASYHEHCEDEEIVRALRSLFGRLGKATGQTTVRFLYHGDNGRRLSYRLRLPNTSHPLDK